MKGKTRLKYWMGHIKTSSMHYILSPTQLWFTYQQMTSLNLVPNAHVCVYLMVHITKLQVQTTFPKPLYIPHSACIH
jgi:hypothetical protein